MTAKQPTKHGPRIQNIPVRTEEGRRIRDAFAPPKLLLNTDYSPLEVRFLSAMNENKIKENVMNKGKCYE